MDVDGGFSYVLLLVCNLGVSFLCVLLVKHDVAQGGEAVLCGVVVVSRVRRSMGESSIDCSAVSLAACRVSGYLGWFGKTC